jgi:hypothetical protein
MIILAHSCREKASVATLAKRSRHHTVKYVQVHKLSAFCLADSSQKQYFLRLKNYDETCS